MSRRVLVFVLHITAVFACASRLDAQVIFQDDFESDVVPVNNIIGGWDGPHDPSTMYVTDRMAHSGHHSLELKYMPGTAGASFMYAIFSGRDDVYVRWYERWSAGFVWEPSATKMAILRPLGGYPQFYPEVLWGGGVFAIQAQVTREANWDSEDFYQNIGDPVVFASERWYCVEVHVKLNTPGVADGRLEAWIDGRLKLEYQGREFRGSTPLDPAPSTAQVQAVGATGYYGGLTPVPQEQYAWQDDFVVSTQPVGYQFLSDDFEDDSTDAYGQISGWDGPARPDTMYIGSQMPHWGTRSLELAYTLDSIGAGYMYRHFQPQDQIYLRWYQRWSTGFAWEPSGTALTGITTGGSHLQFYPFAFGTDGTFAVQAQTVAERNWDSENFLVNLGDSVKFVPDRWYCIEVFVKLNTPGASDGQVAAWIDGEKKLFYDGRQFRGGGAADPSPPTSEIDSLIAAGSYGGSSRVPKLQFSWQDDYAASTGRLGCGAYPPIIGPIIFR
jgi:hypothetical protein